MTFATPIAHQETGDDSSFENALAIGRPFRQPLLTASIPNKHAPRTRGTAVRAGSFASLYSWLDGILGAAPATAGRAARLVRDTEPSVLLRQDGRKRTLACLVAVEGRLAWIRR